MFDAKKTTESLITWVRDFFRDNADDNAKAVIGISGGKDSSITAALLVAALGAKRVCAVLLPNGIQEDIDVSYDLCHTLGLDYIEINIEGTSTAFFDAVETAELKPNAMATINSPARLRMAMLYAVCAIVGGRVANTCNLSEEWVGYSTKYGDSAGDFSPFANFTVAEIKAIGYELGVPERFIEKTPVDGLSGKTDEDNLGFTYAALDKYIRTGVCENLDTKARIDRLHALSEHKRKAMPMFSGPLN